MKIFSEKINYGILAIFELAKNYHKEHIQIKFIAKENNIKQNYLEKVLITLKRGGLVESIRGAQGGYKLRKSPNKIKIIDVIKALEGPIQILDYSNNEEVIQLFWKDTEQRFLELFESTFEDLINDEKILKNKLTYQI